MAYPGRCVEIRPRFHPRSAYSPGRGSPLANADHHVLINSGTWSRIPRRSSVFFARVLSFSCVLVGGCIARLPGMNRSSDELRKARVLITFQTRRRFLLGSEQSTFNTNKERTVNRQHNTRGRLARRIRITSRVRHTELVCV